MKRIKLDTPPDAMKYKNDQLGFMRATSEWMTRTKSKIETASAQNDSPLQQNFVLGSFTTNTRLSGTSTGTDLANALCSLVQSMIDKGFITITTSTGG